MQAVCKREALRDLVDLRLALAPEVLSPLLHQELRHKDVAREPPNAVRQLPHGRGVQRLVLGADFIPDELGERFVDVADLRVVGAPRVDREPVLLREEVLEERHVRRLARDVHHALEADVFVQPDRPTETVLQ